MGLLGGYAKTTGPETFMASRNERHLTEIANLRGARLVVASETATGRHWDESRIKELTGGTRISARFMRQDLFEFIPQLKLVIVGNHKPHLSTVDEAIRRRLQLVPFTLVVPKEDRDLQLAEKLKAEWPAILRWMIDGCLEWQADGLDPPMAVREATDTYFENEDSLGEWIAEACDQGANDEARIKDLFPSWKSFAEAADEFVGTKRTFADALESRGFRRRKIGRARDKGFLGLKLKDIFDASAKNVDVSAEDADRKDSANIIDVTPARAHTRERPKQTPGPFGPHRDNAQHGEVSTSVPDQPDAVSAEDGREAGTDHSHDADREVF
jgi:putative DNA primase/helicase